MAFLERVCHIPTGEIAPPISPSFLLAIPLKVSLTRVSSQGEGEILAGNPKKSLLHFPRAVML